jgi:hypothetical protein
MRTNMSHFTEVERAAKLTRHVALGRTIEQVETNEDTIVYTGGITHTEFVSAFAYPVRGPR